MGRPPVENHTKYRRWKAVVHNVRADCSAQAAELTQAIGPLRFQNAVEPYSHQVGYHLHIYFSFKNQKHFNSLLKELELLSNRLRDSTSEPGTSIGRVELSQWTTGQSWENINQYLTNPVKDKITGEVTSRNNLKYMWDFDLNKYRVVDVSVAAQKKRQAIRRSDEETIRDIHRQVALIPPIYFKSRY